MVDNPEMVDVMADFEVLLTNIMGNQPNHLSNRGFPGPPFFGGMLGPMPEARNALGGHATFTSTRAFPGGQRTQIQVGNIEE